MDCVDVFFLVYTNMQTNFFKKSQILFFQRIVKRNSRKRQIASTISICSCACQPMIPPIKLVTSVLCILAKFRHFLKPVTLL